MTESELKTMASTADWRPQLKPLLGGGFHIQGLTEKGLKDEELANAFKKMIEVAYEKG